MSLLVQTLRLSILVASMACLAMRLQRGMAGRSARFSEGKPLASLIVLHLAAMGCRGYLLGFVPMTSAQDVLLLVSFLLLCFYGIADRRLPGVLPGLGVYVLSAAMVAAGCFGPAAERGPDQLRSAILPLHVTGAASAYACLALSSLLSLKLLFRPAGPSAGAERVASLFSAAGWALYAVFVVVTGMAWAKVTWGRYWNWDPKEPCPWPSSVSTRSISTSTG